MRDLVRVGMVAALSWTLGGLAAPAAAVTIDWVAVGNPGNAADGQTGFGAVADVYRIGRTEVTNSQYAEFLNAVAATDINELYNPFMGASKYGGITRSGSSGSFSYSAIAGREQNPVNYVSFYDTLRFANWLHNGQLSGAQDGTTTEDGAYTITAQGITGNSIVRNPGATVFLTSQDEWYKAAYHNALGLQATDYFAYPAGFDAQTTCTAPTSAANSANCDAPGGSATDPDVDGLTPVGSFTGSASAYGTFDQGGNLSEWNEGIISGVFREIRGGAFGFDADTLAALSLSSLNPNLEVRFVGFRVASVPEPGTGLLVMMGLLGLGAWRSRSA